MEEEEEEEEEEIVGGKVRKQKINKRVPRFHCERRNILDYLPELRGFRCVRVETKIHVENPSMQIHSG